MPLIGEYLCALTLDGDQSIVCLVVLTVKGDQSIVLSLCSLIDWRVVDLCVFHCGFWQLAVTSPFRTTKCVLHCLYSHVVFPQEPASLVSVCLFSLLFRKRAADVYLACEETRALAESSGGGSSSTSIRRRKSNQRPSLQPHRPPASYPPSLPRSIHSSSQAAQVPSRAHPRTEQSPGGRMAF